MRRPEWVGGRFTAPVKVDSPSGPEQPELSLWLEVDGPIVGVELQPPGTGDAATSRLVSRSMKRPQEGPPRKPSRIRVADPALAQAVRAEVGSEIEVVVGPTPELQEALSELKEFLVGKLQPSLLRDAEEDCPPEQVASFHQASAALFRAAPWEVVPSDTAVILVDIEALDVRGQVLSVLGAAEEEFGFVVFRDRDSFEAFIQAALDVEPPAEDEIPDSLSLNFERTRGVPRELRQEARKERWEVASDRAFPMPMVLERGEAVPPTRRHVAILEALARALTALLEDGLDPEEVWGGVGVDRSHQVEANGQQVTVRLRVPRLPEVHAPSGRQFDLRTELRDQDDMLDAGWLDDFARALLELLRASPEGQDLDGDWLATTIQFAARYLDVPIAQVGAPELRELLFDLFPRKLSVPPESATEIVAELRTFWRWADAEFGLETATECLAVLRPGVEGVLERALRDREQHGPAKSLVMGAVAAGYDMSSREGVAKFIADLDAGKLDRRLAATEGIPLPPERRASPGKAQKKKKRKSEKKSRKQNR